MALLLVHNKCTQSRGNGILTCIFVSLYDWKISKGKLSCFSFHCDLSGTVCCSWAVSYNRKSNHLLIALSGFVWQCSRLLSSRPLYNDSSICLHGWASHQGKRWRVWTLLCPSLDLFCPHLPLSNHLPRPAEEKRVRWANVGGGWDHIRLNMGN